MHIMTNLEYLNLVMSTEFPLDHYDSEYLTKQFNNLKYKEQKSLSNTGIALIKHYHPSIWRCNIKNHLAPIDAWNDPEIMLKVIDNRLKYLKTDLLSSYNIRSGLSISKIAPKVSIFRPAMAKYLINKYLNEFEVIFDPCCGFSGRMLGACALNKKYIGQDINSITIKESNQMRDDLKLSADLCCKDSLYDSGEYECLFTCPPYSDKETWHQDIEILSADEWIDACLKNYKCKKYLFVVDKTDKYKDCIVEEIKNSSHFGTSNEKVILIKRDN